MMPQNFFKSKIQAIEVIAIIFLYAFMIYSIASTSLHDDIGFDFAGYAVRYNNAFSGWFEKHHFGLPASTFDAFLPSVFPLLFRVFGFGVFTLPLVLSIILIKCLIPLAFIPLAKFFRQRKTTGVLLGLLFVLNPVTFKFLNRYFELAGWLFFILYFSFLYMLVKGGKFEKKYFILSSVFATAVILSHAIPAFFLGIAALLLLNGSNFKRIAAVGIASIGLSSFWLLPFLYYMPYADVFQFYGTELQTFGILAGTIFSIILLSIATALVFKVKSKNSLEFNFCARLICLSIVQFAFPWLPLIRMPFTHSYHVFYLISIVFIAFIVLREKILPKKILQILALSIAIIALAGIVFVPKISGQYFFTEPRLSNYDLNGEKIPIGEIESQLKLVPPNERFEVMPRDIVINAFASTKYGLITGDGWGYNAFSLKKSIEKIGGMATMRFDCNEFNEKNKELGISKWLALNESAFDFLKKCGWISEKSKAPALFGFSEKISLVESGELLELKQNSMKIRAFPPAAIIKMNFFPRWNAYLENESRTAIESENFFIKIPVLRESVIELKFEQTPIDFIGIIVSIASIAVLAFIATGKKDSYFAAFLA